MTRQVVTPREIQILTELVRDGASNREIGDRLGCSSSTVGTHMEHLYRKTRTKNRTDLALWWVRVSVGLDL